MKKLTIVLGILALVGILCAIDFDYSGELRTRGAATYDDVSEAYHHRIESRFRLALDANIAENLGIHSSFEVGDFPWGTYGGEDFQVETNEVYLDYHMPCLDANLQVGKLYWADHNSLVLDDFFTGMLFTANDLAGLKAELGMMKYPTSLVDTSSTPSTWYMAGVHNDTYLPLGITMMAGYQDDISLQSISIMPYATLQYKCGWIDLNPFIDQQSDRKKTGYGIAVKAGMQNGPVELGADVLYAAKNGLAVCSPWYQNGLYLYGTGTHHDALNMYWNSPYMYNEKSFTSLVGKTGFQINEKAKLFAAVGTLTDLGSEANLGCEFQIIPTNLCLAVYGAMGKQYKTDRMDLAAGTTVMVNF